MGIRDPRNFEISTRVGRKILNDCSALKTCERSLSNEIVTRRSYGSERWSATRKVFSGETIARKTIPDTGRTRLSCLFDSMVSLVSADRALRLHEHVDELHKKLGPIYRDCVGPVSAVFVNSPDDFRKIFRSEGPTPMHCVPEAWGLYNKVRQCPRGLLFMDGDEWLHFRRIMNRSMLVPDPAIFIGPCDVAARDLVEQWNDFADTGNAVPELPVRLYRWSIEVMLATLTGSSWHGYKSRVSKKVDDLAKILHGIFILSARLSLVSAKYAMKLRLPVWRNFCNVVDEALGIVGGIVSEIARLEGDGLLAVMIEEGILSETDIVRIVTDLVIAAGDTTAFATQWSLLLLANDSAVQEKLYDRIKGFSREEILADAFVKAIVKEIMRLYPIAPFLARILPQDSVVAGYHVPKQELIIMSVYSSSRDEKNFPRPNEFVPDRWMRNERSIYNLVTNPHGSLPFALGARSCVGRKLAETQMILTLSEIVKNFHLECPNADRVKMILHLISVPSEPIRLKLRRRR